MQNEQSDRPTLSEAKLTQSLGSIGPILAPSVVTHEGAAQAVPIGTTSGFTDGGLGVTVPPSAFTRGAQIIFIPHGQTADHPNARRGFVTSHAPMGRTVLCQFWQPGRAGQALATPYPIAADTETLALADSCAQAAVDGVLGEMDAAESLAGGRQRLGMAQRVDSIPVDPNAGLRDAFARNGNLSVRDLALEVAFSGRTWKEVCDAAEVISSAEPGLYERLREKLPDGQTFDGVVRDALGAAGNVAN